MSTVPTYVIVGANAAGGTAAAELREQGFDGRVVLIGEEPHPPYERPPLSKEYLRDEQSLDDTFMRPSEWWDEHDVETRFGARAERVDAVARTVALDGDELTFDKLLVATGCRNRRFPIPGLDLPGVLSLRTAQDAEAIREAARHASRVVMVGMGFIGAEVAASLRSQGLDVVVIEPQETPLHRVVGSEIGSVMAALHSDNGVDMHFGDVVERFEGGERVEAVVTKSGKRYECDFSVVGVGVQPNVEVLENSGLEIDNGVVVDDGLESTSVPGVFAAGDVARHDHPVFGSIRVEHFDNALKMGQHAARAMLGDKRTFDDPHWFWSDQYDANIQMAGFALSWDEIVFRGSPEERSFSAFYLKDGAVLSVFALNRPRDVRRSMPLISAQVRPDPAKLRDENVDLRMLVPKDD